MAERLTDRGIAALKPAEKPYLVFDSEVNGLAVRVYPSGIKRFVFDWRQGGKQRRITLGSYPAWTIGKARAAASKLRLKADAGESIAPARGERVGDLIEAWFGTVRLTRRPGTAVGYRLAVDNYILPSFGRHEPRAVGRNVVEAWHAGIAQTTPIQANRCLGVLSSFMSWLEHAGLIDRNPCRGVRRLPENQRHTLLDGDEIVAAHAALGGDNNRSAALALLSHCYQAAGSARPSD
jgi:hypothetical protein